jgi:ADP-heptose:LPS heptosyltransferase
MHLAAALGKRIVCFFGKEHPERWRPWGAPHVVLRSPSREVKDIAVSEVLEAIASLA